MVEYSTATFHWADYLVFVTSLLLSLGIGCYYAIRDRKKQNNEEFLMAGRSMKIAPVTASTFATLVSSIGFVADPVEVYYFGISYLFMITGGMLAIIPIAEVFVPAFHEMNLVSAFQYLEETFNPHIRKMASGIQIVLMLFFMGMMAYAPAVALAQVSGSSVWVGIIVTTIVCTIYTTFGGMKAVVWADTMQMFVMFAGVLVLAFKSMSDLGGWSHGLEIIRNGSRTTQVNWNPNPFVRSGFWAYLIGGFFRVLGPLSSTQIAIQRYCTLSTAREAKISVYLIIPMYVFLSTIFLMVGLSMYGHFATCDPLFSQKIQKIDQYVPFLVMQVLGPWHGLPGLFIACIFAASLSTLSSGQNSLAAVILKDMVEPVYKSKYRREIPERTAFLMAKGIAIIVGLVVLCMAFLVLGMGGNLFMLLNKIFGTLAGPIGGLFTIAIVLKSVRNVKCVMFGFVTATSVGLWITIGSQIYTFRPNSLPISVDGCSAPTLSQNFTTSRTILDHMWQPTPTPGSILDHITTPRPSTLPPPAPAPEPTGFVRIYNLSPMYYALVGYGLTVSLAFFADRIMKCWIRRRERKRAEKDDKSSADGMDSADGDGKHKTVNGQKYTAVLPGEIASWEKEKSTRLSKLPPYIVTKKDQEAQTLESIPPAAVRDILWVYDTETNL